MHIVDSPEPTPSEGEIVTLGLVKDSHAVTTQRYSTNVTTLTERIAIRLAAQGAEHPVAAAVTIAVRGMSRLGPVEYAEALGLAPADVRALEAGTVALGELPPSLWKLIHDHELEPVMLVDLDKQLRDG